MWSFVLGLALEFLFFFGGSAQPLSGRSDLVAEKEARKKGLMVLDSADRGGGGRRLEG